MSENNSATNSIKYSASAALHYEKYSGPVFFEPYAIDVANRIDASAVKVALEIACGTGRVTRHLRKVLSPTSKLIATDISPDMLQVAKDQLTGLAIDWQLVDAQELPYEDNSIDLIVCCFGYMFVPDKIKAFKEAWRVLRPGGTLLFTTWDRLELNIATHIHREVIKKFLGGELPDSYKTAFTMSNEDEINSWLTQAGFAEIKIERVEKTAVSESAKNVAEGLTFGGAIFSDIFQRNPEWLPQIQSEIETVLKEKYGDAPMKAPMRALISSAKKS
jgi:ubiquinone/menaquinone biosynthesis C-methylase UbiE